MVKLIQIFAVCLMLLCASGAMRADDYEDVDAAAHRGDYTTALKLLSPLAQKGQPKAQNYLGSMYHAGNGVTQDYKAAVKWYRLAADQGFAKAQYNIGYMYLGPPDELTRLSFPRGDCLFSIRQAACPGGNLD